MSTDEEVKKNIVKEWFNECIENTAKGDEIPEPPEFLEKTTTVEEVKVLVIGSTPSLRLGLFFSVPDRAIKYMEESGQNLIFKINRVDASNNTMSIEIRTTHLIQHVVEPYFQQLNDLPVFLDDDFGIKQHKDNPCFKKSTKKFLKKTKYPSKKGMRNCNNYSKSRKSMKHNCNK